ncbi:MAG: glycosyltransferase [Planctomycetota bacterium]|nr:glycosyltransferase [Planctomycetota bacterium]
MAHAGGSRMSIALIRSEYPPAAATPAALEARRLAESLAADGCEVHVIAQALSRTPLYEVDGLLHVHRLRLPPPLVRWERVRGSFAVEAARMAMSIHERAPLEGVDASGDPVAIALIRLLGGPAPIDARTMRPLQTSSTDALAMWRAVGKRGASLLKEEPMPC